MTASVPFRPFAAPPVLLAVRDMHEEVRVGLGQASLIVRTLDGVSLAVHAGEMVVLRGGVASGAASLLAVLAGARRHQQRGTRVEAHGVQVRRGGISRSAFDAIASAWSQPRAPDRRIGAPRVAVVYVFRVRSEPDARRQSARPDTRTCADPSVWRAWAASLRATGGSVVAYWPLSECEVVDPVYEHHDAMPGTRTPAVHEAAAGASGDNRGSPGGVRLLTLAAGRIVSADPATRSSWSDGSGDS